MWRDRIVHNGWRRPVFLVVGVLLLFFLGLVGFSITQTKTHAVDGSSMSPEQKAVLCSLEDSFSIIARSARPGVVSITAVHKPGFGGGTGERPQPDSLDQFFRRFFGVLPNGSRKDMPWLGLPPDHLAIRPTTATGSGIIARKNGSDFYVLTNYHVVDGAFRVKVRLADNTEIRGTVVGIDPVTDLAVVKISSPKLSDRNVLPLGDSVAVKVGAWALAMGSPFGFEQTLTVGVVSALQRELEEDETLYLDLIQTDAAINKGNSGGPLLDVEGRVIGVNTAIASPTGGFVGLGFAIPINTAKTVLDTLVKEGRVIRGWLGVGIQDLTPVLQEFYGVDQGVLVASVNQAGPARRAGLQEEDIITKMDDTPLSDVFDLQRLAAASPPGSRVQLDIVRSRQPRRVSVVIGQSPTTPERPSPADSTGAARESIGLTVRTLTGELARRVGLEGTKGVIVADVRSGGVAEEAGLEVGDVIVRLNHRRVETDRGFAKMMKEIRPDGIVVLKVLRDRSPRMIGFRWE